MNIPDALTGYRRPRGLWFYAWLPKGRCDKAPILHFRWPDCTNWAAPLIGVYEIIPNPAQGPECWTWQLREVATGRVVALGCGAWRTPEAALAAVNRARDVASQAKYVVR